MFFLELLLDRFSSILYRFLAQNNDLWLPLATQEGPKIHPGGVIFAQKGLQKLRAFRSEAFLEPTWRPKVAQDAPNDPRAPFLSIFIDLSWIWVAFLIDF